MLPQHPVPEPHFLLIVMQIVALRWDTSDNICINLKEVALAPHARAAVCQILINAALTWDTRGTSYQLKYWEF